MAEKGHETFREKALWRPVPFFLPFLSFFLSFDPSTISFRFIFNFQISPHFLSYNQFRTARFLTRPSAFFRLRKCQPLSFCKSASALLPASACCLMDLCTTCSRPFPGFPAIFRAEKILKKLCRLADSSWNSPYMKMSGLKKEGACQLKRMTSRSSDLWSFKLALTIKKQVCDPYSRTAITPVHSKFGSL